MASETFMRRLIGSSKKYMAPSIKYYKDAECTEELPIEVEMNNNTGIWQIRFLESGYLKFSSLKENSTIDIFACGGGGGGAKGASIKYSDGYLRPGGGGGGGGYCATTFAVPVHDEVIYAVNVGLGGQGTIENSSTVRNGSDGQASFVKANDTVIISAAGGKGGTIATSAASKTKIKAGGRGGDGGSGGGNGGSGTIAGGAGGRNGSAGGKGAVNNATRGGAGSGTSTTPFGEANGNTYGSGGAGGTGCRASVAAGRSIGGSSTPAKGGLFNAVTPGGGDGAFTPSSGFVFNKAYFDLVPNDPNDSGVVLTSGTNAGLTVYKKGTFDIRWKNDVFAGKNGTPNTGGGGGGGAYFFQGANISFYDVPCVDSNGKEITVNISAAHKGHNYRGGDGGSGIVIIRGNAINKEEGE